MRLPQCPQWRCKCLHCGLQLCSHPYGLLTEERWLDHRDAPCVTCTELLETSHCPEGWL